MRYYLAWVTEDELFDPKQHARQDEEMFYMLISEKEGLAPKASITVANKPNRVFQLGEKTFAYLSVQVDQEVHLLFKGRLVTFPMRMEGETVTLDLIVEPTDAETQLKTLSEALCQAPYYDPLFLAPEKRIDPDSHEILDARDAFFYWSRTTGKVSLSSLMQGRETLTLQGRHFYESLDQRIVGIPLSQIDVELKVQWRQLFLGETSLDHLIQASLPGGLLSTLTGENLEESWWEEGEPMGRSGYRILKSRLQKVDAPQRSLAVSEKIWISPHDPFVKQKKRTSPSEIRFKKAWYRPQLKVSWRYCQKRVEKVFFTLKNDVFPLGLYPHRSRVLALHLQRIMEEESITPWLPQRLYFRGETVNQRDNRYLCLRTHRSGNTFQGLPAEWREVGASLDFELQKRSGTFFTLDRGVQAVEHAIEIARTHLAVSSRALEVRFSCDLKDGMKLTCDHTVILVDDRLPGGQVMGKVKQISLEVLGRTGKSQASVILACSLGSGAQPKVPKAESHVYAENFFESGVINENRFRQTPSGIYYQTFYDQTPERGQIFPAFLTGRDILRRVEIVNDAAAQEKHLLEKQYPLTHSVQNNLQAVKTAVRLSLEDLRSLPVLEHHIFIEIPLPWSAPRHIYFNQ